MRSAAARAPPRGGARGASGAGLGAYDALRDQHIKFDHRRPRSFTVGQQGASHLYHTEGDLEGRPSSTPPTGGAAAASSVSLPPLSPPKSSAGSPLTSPVSFGGGKALSAGAAFAPPLIPAPTAMATATDAMHPSPALPPVREDRQTAVTYARAAAGVEVAGGVRPAVVFLQARDKLQRLWDELGVDDAVRAHFHATAFREVSSSSIAALHAEIERLVAVRSRYAEIGRAIEVREGALYVLLDLVNDLQQQQQQQQALSDGASSVASLTPAANAAAVGVALDAPTAKQVRQIVTKLRKATFTVIHAIQQWRRALGQDAVYTWRGTSYLIKMATDLAAAAVVPAVSSVIHVRIVGNPLLDPHPPASAHSGGAGVTNTNMNTGTATTSFSREQYRSAWAVLEAEGALWRHHQNNTRMFRFEADYDAAATPDETIVSSVYVDCYFSVPEEQSAAARQRAAEEMRERFVVIMRVTRIQRAVRRLLAGRRRRALERRHHAAVVLQREARRMAARRELLQRRAQHAAAARIQAIVRGSLTRSVSRQRRETSEAAATIQCAFRRHRERNATTLWQGLHRAATVLQALARGAAARRRASAIRRQSHQTAAVSVQRMWKGHALRQRGTANPHRVAAALRLQRWWRQAMAVRFVTSLRGLHRAANTIQRAVRAKKQR